MKQLLVIIFTIPLYLFSAPNVSDQRVLALLKKVDIKATLKGIKGGQATIKIIHPNGVSGLFLRGCEKKRCISSNNMFFMTWVKTDKNKQKILKKINIFNEKLLFAKVHYEQNSIILQMDLISIKGATDIRIINFFGTYLAIRDRFLDYFKTMD